ncbi:DUF6343 family protein [Streptomyces sp. NPDC088789]|uniref:DUF6343 family protein n=1 Tax=Streptomyces sp. NPDC088789 TaxID=3365899 RepID=UPI0037FFE87C
MTHELRRRSRQRDEAARSGTRVPRSGTEPVTARSPLRLRKLLSGIFLPLFVAGTVLFAVWAALSGPGDSPGRAVTVTLAAVCAALALTAALDLVVLARRGRQERAADPAALGR